MAKKSLIKNIAKFVAQFDRLTFSKEGGGKITFEFSQDALKDLQKLQDWNMGGNLNFAIAISPLDFQDAYEHDNMEF